MRIAVPPKQKTAAFFPRKLMFLCTDVWINAKCWSFSQKNFSSSLTFSRNDLRRGTTKIKLCSAVENNTVYAVLTPKHEDRTVFEKDRTNLQYGVLIEVSLRPVLLSPKSPHARFMISSLSRSEPKALSSRSTLDCLWVRRSNVNDPSFCYGR